MYNVGYLPYYVTYPIRWNLSYPNPLGPGWSISLISAYLCIINLKIALIFLLNFQYINYPNRTVTTLIEQP